MDDIPPPLTKLIQFIMRHFYSIEQKILIDLLIKRRETKEDDVIEILKFERKHLRAIIQQLKQDKFINVRLIMLTGEDSKSTRHNYYSINYRMFVNVVKYKIDHMRRKLETEERDLTSRASFICQSCNKTFTDLDAAQIYDPQFPEQFRCSYCDGIVDEDPNVQPKADSRMVMANFNQQMEPIYTLLQETENIKWSILEADRSLPPTTQEQAAPSVNTKISSEDASAEDWASVAIDLGEAQPKKNSDIRNPEVEALLLREECSTAITNGNHTFIEEDEEDDSPLMISVGQRSVPINEMTDEHVLKMTPQQKEDYARIMQQIYSMYD